MSRPMSASYWTNLGATLFATLRSYPRESLIAAATSCALCIMAADTSVEIERLALRTSLGLVLGIAISLTCTVLFRAGKINIVLEWLIATIGVSLSIWHAHSMNLDNAEGVIEYAYLFVFVHLCVVCAWIAHKGVHVFWNATTGMFYRALYAVIFTSLLQSGLSLAILAISLLFGLLQYAQYDSYIASIAYGMFMTLFFLAEFPTYEFAKRDPVVPKLTVAFVQYVLVPLIAVFAAILYAYAVKLVTTAISSDMALYVVILAGVSILATLLTWPIRNEQKPLLRFLHTWLYPLLLPLLMMGAWSLSVLFSTDGVTRYGFTLGVLLLIGLLTVVISMSMRTSDPRIPAVVSLVVFLLTSVGPTGVNSIVAWSQATQSIKDVAVTTKQAVGGLPPALPSQPDAAFNSVGDRWMLTFNCDAGDTLTYSDVVVTCTQTGVVTAIHKRLRDTAHFQIADVLSRISTNDTLYRPVTAPSGSDRTATLMCSSITTDVVNDDPNSKPKRVLYSLRGTVSCEPR